MPAALHVLVPVVVAIGWAIGDAIHNRAALARNLVVVLLTSALTSFLLWAVPRVAAWIAPYVDGWLT